MTQSTGKTLYVAPNGNDAWSGSLPEPNTARTDGPLATLMRVAWELGPGDTCTFRISTCVDVSPKDTAPTSYPFYARAGLRTAQTPMKKVECFVADRIVEDW